MIGILYFSSTGNSLYIAQKIQDQMGGQIKYIPNYNGNGSEFEKSFWLHPFIPLECQHLFTILFQD